MTKCKGSPYNPITFSTQDDEDLREIIEKNKEDFLEYIHKMGLNVEYNAQTKEYRYSETTILTLKTTCFKVDFNDAFVTISPLK